MSGHCRTCGAENVEGAISCHRCGQPLACGEEPSSEASDAADASIGSAAETVEHQNIDHDCPNSVETRLGEEQIWSGSYSPRAMLPACLLAVLLSVVIGGASVPFAGVWNAAFITFVCTVLTSGGVGLYLAYRRLSAHYELTSERFEFQTGFRTPLAGHVEVIDIDDVAFGQGPFERYLDVGTVKVMTSSPSHPELLLPGIGSVQAVATKIDNARRAARRRRGWFIEDAAAGEEGEKVSEDDGEEVSDEEGEGERSEE